MNISQCSLPRQIVSLATLFSPIIQLFRNSQVGASLKYKYLIFHHKKTNCRIKLASN